MTENELRELSDMDWGGLAVEFVRGNELIHLFNHDLANRKNVARNLRFIKSRIAWCNTCMPTQLRHTVIIDDTDRGITDSTRTLIRAELENVVSSLRFATEGRK